MFCKSFGEGLMDAIDVARNYFDTWNSRDQAAIGATLADGGTYEDPASGGGLSGPALAQYSGGLLAAFPDLSFEIISIAAMGDGVVAAEWLMTGTNSGPFGGGPPTGNRYRCLAPTLSK